MMRRIWKLLPAPLAQIGIRVIETLSTRRLARGAFYAGDSASVLQCQVAYNKYGGYCIPLSSRFRPTARRIISGGVWEPDTLEFLVARCGDGDIVHAGAYFGDFLPALSQAVRPGATVWAFEPNPENHRCAALTIAINDLPNVVLTNGGLGAEHGSLRMVTSDESGRSLGGASWIVPEAGSNNKERTIAVDIVTVDEVVGRDRRVSIIQLDVQGFEQQALAGALKTIKRCKPLLVLEGMPEEAWLTENILSLGYQIERQIHANTVLRAA
jgi:FkbM family methyltransferase